MFYLFFRFFSTFSLQKVKTIRMHFIFFLIILKCLYILSIRINVFCSSIDGSKTKIVQKKQFI